MHPEVSSALGSFEDFAKWYPEHLIGQQSIEAAIDHIRCHGIQSSFFGDIPPRDIAVTGDNYREQLLAHGLNARQRALLECMASDPVYCNHPDPKIFAPEAITPLAMTLRSRHRFFIGSEFYPSSTPPNWLYPTLRQDLLALSFYDQTFDLVLTSDVLEHVADLHCALSEIARVLKPGGLMLSTHPFTWQAKTCMRAKMSGDAVQHFVEPEYHLNPASPEEGSLVFAIPGWDILEMCKDVGFSSAEMVLIASTSKGLLASSPAYINVLRAYR